MRRAFYLILIVVFILPGCKQLNRFHENELTLEVSYINDMLDDISVALEEEDMEILARHFISDSTLNWTLPGTPPNNSGWNGFSTNVDIHFRVRTGQERTVSERVINIDDHGNVAWFIETINLKFMVADSVYKYPGAVVSGVLTKSGEQWRIVQWHESY